MSGIFDQIINYSPPLIVSGTVNYDGTWNASTNTPTLNNPPAASTKGDYYVVSTAGTQFSITFAVGDWIISNGTAWEKVDLTDAVSSVFGRTGAVVGVSTDYSAVGLTNTAIGASSPSTGAFTTVSASTPIAVASGGTGVTTSTGTTNVVLSNSPTLVTPILGTPQSGTLTSCTGLPISTGVSGLGTGVATALAVNTGSAGAPVLFNGALGTPSSGTVTNLTGTASININGTVGATTPSTVAATTISATGLLTVSTTSTSAALLTGNNSATGLQIVNTGATASNYIIQSGGTAANALSIYNVTGSAYVAAFTSTGLNSTAIGATTPSTGAFTTLSATGNGTFSGNGATLTFSGSGSPTITASTSDLKITTTSVSTDIVVDAKRELIQKVNGTTVGLISSTGLAVTGALSSTTGANFATSSGSVGIGTASPTGNLHVYGAASATANLVLQAPTYDIMTLSVGASTADIKVTSTTPLRFLVNSAEAMRIINGGNVGIGTASPAEKLTVNGAVAITGAITGHGANRTTLSQEGANGAFLQSYGADASTPGAFVFRQASSDFSINRNPLVIDSSGNVGIGTASPSNRLHVENSTNTVAKIKTTGAGSYGALQIYNSNTNGEASIGFRDDSDADAASWVIGKSVNATDAFGWYYGASIMTLTTGGNLGIGTTSPGTRLHVQANNDAFRIQAATSTSAVYHTYYNSAGTRRGYIGYGTGGDALLDIVNEENGAMRFSTNNTERARIDSSGNLLVGTTTASASPATGVQLCNTSGTLGGVFIGHDTGTATGNYYATFNYASGVIGSITQSGTTAVVYNTTSDYRRKSNVKDLTGSGTFIDALKPRTFDWDTGDKGVGFLAHEFAEVSPLSVSGEKDAVDADGKPVYQSMQASTSEVIANLVAELQSLRARVAALESK